MSKAYHIQSLSIYIIEETTVLPGVSSTASISTTMKTHGHVKVSGYTNITSSRRSSMIAQQSTLIKTKKSRIFYLERVTDRLSTNQHATQQTDMRVQRKSHFQYVYEKFMKMIHI